MKLLFLLNSIRVSGSDKMMIELSRRFADEGCKAYLFPLVTPFDNEFKDSVESDGVKMNILMPRFILAFDKLIWKLNGLTVFLFNWSLRTFFLQEYISSACKKNGIQVVISNSYPTDLFVGRILKKTAARLVVVDHGSYSTYIRQQRPFNGSVLKIASAVVAVSDWTASQLAARFPELKITRIYNGYVPMRPNINSTQKHSRSFSDSFTFCMHGRGAEQKGWDLAIEAFQMLKRKGYNISLILMSEGSYITGLKSRHGGDPDLVFAGFEYNLRDAFTRVDAGLLLSKKFEAFGLSILDYFAVGIPVVASNVGGIPEVVIHDELAGGILVEVDEFECPPVGQIVTAMEELIVNKIKYERFSADGPKIAEYFSMERCHHDYRTLFKTLLVS